MATIAPIWTPTTVIAAQALSAGAQARATLDLSGKIGAWLSPAIAKGSTASGSLATFAAYRRGGASAEFRHPSSLFELADLATAANETTVNADASAGATDLTVASSANFVAGAVISIEDGSGGGLTRFEIGVVVKVSGNVLTLAQPLQFAHTSAQADKVRNTAAAFGPVWVPGGATYDLVFVGAATGGAPRVVRCTAQTLDGHTVS